MFALWWALGALCAFVGWLDVFFTVLHYDSRGLVTIRLYHGVWFLGRRISNILPGRLRPLSLSLLAPAMVVLTVATWLALEILGFALLFYPSMLSGGFHVGKLHPGFATSIYFSLGTLTSLSFSDVEPLHLGDHLVAATETLVGLALLTLGIAYVANLYRAIQEQSVLASRLYQRTGGSGDGRDIVAAHFLDGQAVDLGSELRDMHASLISQYEDLRRYPVVYYFHARVPYRSIPYVFKVMGTVIAALSFGLPPGHPAARDPWLQGLRTAYCDVVERLEREFLTRKPPDPPLPLSLIEFQEKAGQGSDQHEAGRFLELVRFMQKVSLAGQEPAAQVYSRYREWLPFFRRSDDFVHTAATEMGMAADHIWEEPAQRLY